MKSRSYEHIVIYCSKKKITSSCIAFTRAKYVILNNAVIVFSDITCLFLYTKR